MFTEEEKRILEKIYNEILHSGLVPDRQQANARVQTRNPSKKTKHRATILTLRFTVQDF